MIPRYSRPAMTALWAPQQKFAIWLDIEIHALEAQENLGIVPTGTAAEIRRKASFTIERIDAHEKILGHDVIAFLTTIAESVGESARFMHYGMTSSDVLDTCFALQLSRAANLLIIDLDDLLAALKQRAHEHQNTRCIGRTHGVHAEPISFGLKLASAYAEFDRNRRRLIMARDDISIGAISGAVGTFATIDPAVEAHVTKSLGLGIEPISTQIIPRDRHAWFFATLGVIASSLERLAVELRHLQRSEVLEVEEAFASGQKGSSAMPHKRNPIATENITGLARLIRSAVIPALENVALWHERDISHSSVERVIAPDCCILLDFALARMSRLIRELIVHKDAMKANLDRHGSVIYSQNVLLALIKAGLSREQAYQIVQDNAQQAWTQNQDFYALLRADARLTAHLDTKTLDACFDPEASLQHTETLFRRVFGSA